MNFIHINFLKSYPQLLRGQNVTIRKIIIFIIELDVIFSIEKFEALITFIKVSYPTNRKESK